ncbi:hypothetical protein JHK87_023876 [Glycine soja]|nr:hypothetical protein JHK87_023876 [Glycine soja]
MELLEAHVEGAKGSKSNSNNRYDSGSQNGSTINSGNYTNNNNSYDDSYHYWGRAIITPALSMVMTMGDILRMALTSQEGATMIRNSNKKKKENYNLLKGTILASAGCNSVRGITNSENQLPEFGSSFAKKSAQ